MGEPILLVQWRAPGDTICSTAAVRDLAMHHPGRFEIHIAGACSAIWDGNPHIAHYWSAQYPRGMPRIELSYHSALAAANHVRLHFLTAFHRLLEEQLNIDLPVQRARGDLHLARGERSYSSIDGRYWLMVAGGMHQIRTKIWPADYAQETVRQLSALGIRVVQVGARYHGHEHPALHGVIDLVGRTTLREMLRLVFHADGVICPVTFAMHAAAAFDKPCVVIAGGREPWWWESYTNSADRHFGPDCPPVKVPHRFLHTQGRLDCCHDGGCWKTTLPTLGPPGPHDCVDTRLTAAGRLIPACLAGITPVMVVQAVQSYYAEGLLAVPSKKQQLRPNA